MKRTSLPLRRRDFIALFGGAAMWPAITRAQQGALPVIGILGSPMAESYSERVLAFRQGLMEAGFVEGRNVAIEQRWADDQPDRLPAMAADLVHARVALIVTIGNNLAARAAQAATTTVPIVFYMGADPLQMGLVSSLGRPLGNITGVSVLSADQVQKRLQLLHDIVPNAKVVGIIADPDNQGVSSSGRNTLDLARETVGSMGGKIEVAYARTVGDFDAAFATLVARRIDALATTSDSLFISGRAKLIDLAAKRAIPTVYHATESARDGGLVSYSTSATDALRQTGLYAGRILKGEKPANLPVLLPTKFEFVINLKTAKMLGITISPQLLVAADEVLE